MEQFDTKKCADVLEAIRALKVASDLLYGNFRLTEYAEMMSEFSNSCNNMAEELEMVVENEIANSALTSNA